MKRLYIYAVLVFVNAEGMQAQGKIWSLDECISYAAANSPGVRIAVHGYDTDKGEYAGAVAAFFPSVSAGSSAQYSFGRAVDPETNTYINTTTFNNGYEGGMSTPLFRGGQLVNRLRLARNNREMGRNEVRKAKDDVAMAIMEVYVNAAYYQGTVRFAEEKLEESRRNLLKARTEEGLGLKGKADVALIEAAEAGDEYGLTRQRNLYGEAVSKLKEYMNFPYDEELEIDCEAAADDCPVEGERLEDVFEYAKYDNPAALQASYRAKAARLSYLVARGRLFPSISLSAGVYTSYYENFVSVGRAPSFMSQMRNNRGEYISLNIRMPLFDGQAMIADARRARNDMRIAQERHHEVVRQLRTAIEQAILDREAYARECLLMEKKMKADEIAYRIALRKYEEGLMSPLDLLTCANILVESKANLLRGRLMYMLKRRLVKYYKGGGLMDNNHY